MTELDTSLDQICRMMITPMPKQSDNDTAIVQAARDLLARFGDAAVEEATARAAALANEARWPEHALALRVLTAVEELARQ